MDNIIPHQLASSVPRNSARGFFLVLLQKMGASCLWVFKVVYRTYNRSFLLFLLLNRDYSKQIIDLLGSKDGVGDLSIVLRQDSEFN